MCRDAIPVPQAYLSLPVQIQQVQDEVVAIVQDLNSIRGRCQAIKSVLSHPNTCHTNIKPTPTHPKPTPSPFPLAQPPSQNHQPRFRRSEPVLAQKHLLGDLLSELLELLQIRQGDQAIPIDALALMDPHEHQLLLAESRRKLRRNREHWTASERSKSAASLHDAWFCTGH